MGEDHFGFWKRQAKFITKFSKAADRMRDAFERNGEKCGYYDPNNLPHGGPERKRRDLDDVDRYNHEDPTVGTKQITTGFRKWAERYISQCSGQRQYQHQVNRMNKWNDLLQAHLASQEE